MSQSADTLGDQDDQFLMEFVAECVENLMSIEQQLLNLEDRGNAEDTINHIFRTMHSIKGASGFFKLEKIQALSHGGENLLSKIRDRSMEASSEVIDILLILTDQLRAMMEDPKLGADFDISENLGKLDAMIHQSQGGGTPAAKVMPSPVVKPAPVSLHAPALPVASAPPKLTVRKKDLQEALSKAQGPGRLFALKLEAGALPRHPALQQHVQQGLASFGKLLLAYPSLAYLQSGQAPSVTLFLQSPHTKEAICTALGIQRHWIAEIKRPTGESNSPVAPSVPMALPKAPPDSPASLPALKPEVQPPTLMVATNGQKGVSLSTNKATTKAEPQTIRIGVGILDELLELIGEVVMGRNQFLSKFENDRAFASLSQSITKLHKHVIQTRMQPIGSIFEKFKRVVRDLAKQLNKSIELKIDGGDIELDRTILEAFSDPLTHLIRNAADHGIESPDERTAQGKPSAGQVCLRAYHESGQIIIEVEDDGRGIDSERIRSKAIEKGVISAKAAETMSEKEIVNLICHPGFSTAEQVTDVSGRGVGMDVVKTNFEKLGCIFDISTQKGKGTLFSARMPLTQAIVNSSVISGLIIRMGNFKLAIPQLSVNEMIRLSPAERNQSINSINQREVLTLRDMILPIIHLEDVLSIPRSFLNPIASSIQRHESNEHNQDDLSHYVVMPDRRKRLSDRRKNNILNAQQMNRRQISDRRNTSSTFLILQFKQDFFAMPVNKIIGTEEIVVKKIPHLIKYRKVYDGVTILGDGEIALILNVNGIVENAAMDFQKQKSSQSLMAQSRQILNEEKQKIIVFSNSPHEFFGLPVNIISEVQKIDMREIQRVGPHEFIQLHGESINLVRLEKHLEMSPLPAEARHLFMIIPNRLYNFGILASGIITTLEMDEQLKIEDTDSSKGMVGRFFHEGRLVTMIDVYTLLYSKDQERFKLEMDPGLERARILVAEDQPFFRKLLRSYLNSYGIKNITMTHNGKEALEVLRQSARTFDLVVSDIHMPQMDGYQLATAIKSDPKTRNVPTLALTSMSGEENVKRALDSGFDAYEVKIDKLRVIQRVVQLLQDGRK